MRNENKLGNDDYVGGCARNEKSGVMWLTARLFELRRIDKRLERKALLPMCLGEEHAKYSLLKC